MISCIVSDCDFSVTLNAKDGPLLERAKRIVIDHVNQEHPGYNIEIPCTHDWELRDTTEASVTLTSDNDFGKTGETVVFPIEVSTCRRCLQTLNQSVEPKVETADLPPKESDGEAD